MKLNATCISCMIQRQEELIRKYPDEEKNIAFIKEILRLIYNAEDSLSAPSLVARIQAVHGRYYGTADAYSQVKEEYNQIMLDFEPLIREKIEKSDDKIAAAMKLAIKSNYIDFALIKELSNEKLFEMLDQINSEEIKMTGYSALLKDLANSENLVYITDNCGEIVADKLLIEALLETYPRLNIDVIVRGKPVINDATLDDAKMVGLDKIVRVTSNGTDIAGTDLDEIDPSAKKLIGKADVIISKGQGNFETLNGCGLNIYYMFLCKCALFVRRFNLDYYTGVLINEKTIRN